MSAKTREQLYSDFSNNQTATGEKFEDLIDSFKPVQSAVSDPASEGSATEFISNISQDVEGKITVQKKSVNFNGYQTKAGMAGYQNLDLQKVDNVTVGAGKRQDIIHKMKHYPTVRLLDVATGLEVLPSEYQVKHVDNMNVSIILGGSLTGRYIYILD